jgi:hypothetical protein
MLQFRSLRLNSRLINEKWIALSMAAFAHLHFKMREFITLLARVIPKIREAGST